jgi:hypothetical protein
MPLFLRLCCSSTSKSNPGKTSETYSSGSVSLAVQADLSGVWAVGGVVNNNVGGVRNGVVGTSGNSGSSKSNDGGDGELHLD